MGDEYENESFHTPLLHLLFHVDALFLQQLPLSEGPVDRFCWCLSTWGPLSLQASLLRVIKAEHMAFPHDYTVSWKVHITSHISDKTLLILLVFPSFHCDKSEKATKCTWPQNDETGHSFSIDICLRPFTRLQDNTSCRWQILQM